MIDPHYFRRAVHAFGASFVVWYLLPTHTPAWRLFKLYAPFVILGLAALVELLRLRGTVPSHELFGLREYERDRVGAYLYFGVATVVLFYLTPQAVAIPCLVGMALGDPVMGELRQRGHARAALLAGAILALALFLLAGWATLPAAVAAVAMAAGEAIKVPRIDDDFLMALAPALVLVAMALLGLAQTPPDFLFPLAGWT